MSAPAGLCESCGMPMQWTFLRKELMVRCDGCIDLFGTEFAGSYREGREASEAEALACWFSRNMRQIGQNAT